MSICRIPLFGFALALLATSVGYCQPPNPTASGSFKYAHTGYPESSLRPATGANQQSEWISDSNLQQQAHSADQNIASGEEATKKTPLKPQSSGIPSFSKWFSRSRKRASTNHDQKPRTAVNATPASKQPASASNVTPKITTPANHSAQAIGPNQLDIQARSVNKKNPAIVSDKVVAASHNTATVSSDNAGGGQKATAKPSLFSAFARGQTDESRLEKKQVVEATTVMPNQMPTSTPATNVKISPSLPSSVAEQAVATSKLAENPLNRPKIIFQPVAGGVDSRGNALLRPSVQVANDDANVAGSDEIQLTQFSGEGTLPEPSQVQTAPEMAYPIDDEWMPPVVANDEYCDCEGSGGFGHHMHGNGPGHGPGYAGVGREYVMHSPFFIDTSQPFNNCRIRGDAARNWEFPDRAEYFWAKTPGGNGPGPDEPGEPSVNYQDIAFFIEKGWERFSIGTNIPIRSVDPEVRSCTTGLANMEVTAKTVLLDGCRFQLTQIFSTHLPTGSAHRGTGNGHVSLEPGIAYRYKWNDLTYLHGDLTYLFPIGADPDFAGQFLNYGIGISHVWIETDTYALIPTFEVDAWTVLDGQQTLPGVANFDPGDPLAMPPVPPSAISEEVDSIGIVNVHPGLRWVCDKGGDCGVKEFGISSGVCVTRDSWYEELLRIEFRWSR